MPNFSLRQSALILLALSALMWLTRGQHIATLTQLPDASWAIFFALGFYFRRNLLLPLFLAQAALIDYLAITQFGVSDYCVTPAYTMLLPAYAALWLAGRNYAARFRFNWPTLLPLTASAAAGTLVCELISSGSFYFTSGRFADTSLTEFGSRIVQYLPGNLASVALYLGCIALTHGLIVYGQQRAAHARAL